MISITNETLVPLREAPKHLPIRPNGKRLHISAVYRWIRSGMRGVILESLKIGGTTYTSQEAMQRFAAKLSGGIRTVPTVSRKMNSQSMITQALQIELGLDPKVLRQHQE